MGFSLVIMAAGLGTRFGGDKQLAKVGQSGEAFLDFSIQDALATAFDEVILIVRSDNEQNMRDHVAIWHPDLSVKYVRQDDFGPPRDKPWGTAHAVLSARQTIDGPFAVINADDYYGPSSFKLAAKALNSIAPGVSCNVVFSLGHTVPSSGSVTRAIMQVENGKLIAIVETDGCERLEDGTLMADGNAVANNTPVSMNLWCFDTSILDDLAESWEAFYTRHADDGKSEIQLPTVVGDLMADGRLRVDVVASPEQWIGITNPEDYELAKKTRADRSVSY
jgi:NDP-sugar pyrophosphorylase family protein